MIEKETFNEKAFIVVNSVGLRQQGQHLPHQLGGLLVSGQGEGHELLIPLERVEGVQLGEALLEGLIGSLVWRVLDEVHHLSCVSTA